MVYRTEKITDKSLLADYFRRDPFVNAYALGDLDPFFWPRTEWFGIYDDRELKTVALLYRDESIPVLLAVDREIQLVGQDLLPCLSKYFPHRFYAHLAPGLLSHFEGKYPYQHYGTYLKMGLKPSSVFTPCHEAHDIFMRRLTTNDLNNALQLFKKAYPHNWFASRMLETGKFFGAFDDQEMIGIAGVHVYSPEYQAAALGNITVAHSWRGRHIGSALTSLLCEDLLRELDVITLNVKEDNLMAIRCYEKLGFKTISSYEEIMINP